MDLCVTWLNTILFNAGSVCDVGKDHSVHGLVDLCHLVEDHSVH